MEKLTDLGKLKILRFSSWEKVPGLCQGVNVRSGVSENSDFFSEIAGELKAFGFSDLARVKQVHGNRVVRVPADNKTGGGIEEADGLTGDGTGNSAGIVTVADCVPVFLLDTASCGWALLHAGWRGTAAGILQQGVKRLIERADSRPDKLELYLGPAVCGSCYEVGPEVAAIFEPQEVKEKSSAKTMGEKKHLDLRNVLSSQARTAGIPPANIRISRYCTRCDNHLFYSYRVEGKLALRRMWAFLGYKPVDKS
jgi:purine-nucleoside/S-methyl-5'-thioadenosine phosphorylase / adenosine deaminase